MKYNNRIIKAEITADRTIDSILAEYGASLADVEIEGNYVTIYTTTKPDETLSQVLQHIGNGDLWVEDRDGGLYITNDKEGKFFCFALIDDEGTRYVNKDGLCEYLEMMAFQGDKKTQKAFKTAIELLKDKSKCKENFKKAVELYDEVHEIAYEMPWVFPIKHVDEKPWARYVVIRALKFETRSATDIMNEYNWPPELCREESNYVEITVPNPLFPPLTNDPWVAEKPDETFVTSDRSHSVFGYSVLDEYGLSFMNKKELVEILCKWLNEKQVPSSVKDECAELQGLLNGENPDMDLVLDLVNITREGGAFDGMLVNKIPCGI